MKIVAVIAGAFVALAFLPAAIVFVLYWLLSVTL